MHVSHLQHSVVAKIESQDKLNLGTVPDQLYSLHHHQGLYSKIKSHSGACCSETNQQCQTNIVLRQFSL